MGSNRTGFGYGPLIHEYVAYLKTKIEFHRAHPEFTGKFNYEEYQSLKGIADVNEGYETILELCDLLTRLQAFVQTVLLRGAGAVECRVAALVPVILESEGIYKFLTSMLSAMHLSIESPEPLVPLVERYNQQFWELKAFYRDARSSEYLTRLIAIPTLPDAPPSFLDIVPSRSPPPPAPVVSPAKVVEPVAPPEPEPEVEPVVVTDLLGDAVERPAQSDADQLKSLQYGAFTNTVQTIAVPVIDTNLQLAHQQLQEAYLQLQAQYNQLLGHVQDLEGQNQHERSLRSELQRQLDLREMRLQDQQKMTEEHMKALRAEIELWRTMYGNLREEHLPLLAQSATNTEADRLRREAEEQRRQEEEQRRRAEEDARRAAELDAKRKAEEEARLRFEEEERLRIEAERLRLDSVNPFDDPANQLQQLVDQVEDAASKFSSVALDVDSHTAAFPKTVHAAILGETGTMTGAIGNLIRHAIAAQKEILAEGKGSGSPEDFYLKNSKWSNGLISAAQAVARTTVLLVETANGALLGDATLEQLVVASQNVAAATAQLVAASRVKAVKHSTAQPLLEDAAKAVSDSNRRLVLAVNSAAAEDAHVSVPTADTASGFQALLINKNADIAQLSRKLEAARASLADIRRAKYTASDEPAGTDAGFDLEEMNKQVEIKELEKDLGRRQLEYGMLQLKKPDTAASPDLGFEHVDSLPDTRNDHGSLLM